MSNRKAFTLRKRRCKWCRKQFRAERRSTCSLECQAELSKAIAAKQKEAHAKQLARVQNLKQAMVGNFINVKPSTVHEAIESYGHDEDFEPIPDSSFLPTDAPAGTPEKIEVLRSRVERGQPLWHERDRIDYGGLTGVVQPVDRTPMRVSQRNVTKLMYSSSRKRCSE